MFDSSVIERVTAYLEGTCKSVSDAATALDLDEDDVLKAIVDGGDIELCTICGWWCEMCEMEEIDNELCCADCRYEDDAD